MNLRINLTADTDRHHAAGHTTVSSIANSTFFVLLRNISNYIITNNQMFVFLALQSIVVVFAQPGSGLYPPRFRGFLITHNDAPQSAGLLWTRDQSVADTSTWQHTTLTTDKHPRIRRIRTHNLSGRAAEDLRLRPRGHWDWQE
jgi:hypothetical protein